MNSNEKPSGANLRPIHYWWLWVLDTLLVSAGIVFFLALQYGTYEFFGRACAMALLPFIPVSVLVGGAGSTVFALTKVWIEKRAWRRPMALTLLVGPALVVTCFLVILGVSQSPSHRLGYICLGNAPAAARQIQIAGYSTFLREEWLAVFQAGPTDFQTLITRAKLVPADRFEFKTELMRTSFGAVHLAKNLPPLDRLVCYKRVFNEPKEHQRGSVYAGFDPATSQVVVLREYHD